MIIHTETLETLSSGQSKDISLVEIWNKATRNEHIRNEDIVFGGRTGRNGI